MLAGSGIRAGVSHGTTDADGSKVLAGAVSVPDLMATMVHALGVDPARSVVSPLGRPIAVTDGGTPVRELLA